MAVTAPPRRPLAVMAPPVVGAQRWRPGRPRRRLAVLLMGSCLAFAAVVARLTFVQTVEHERYADYGASQRFTAVDLPADRGALLDRNGVELALTVTRPTVWADPRLVDDPVATARALAAVLDLDRDELAETLSAEGAFAYVARKVDHETAEEVAALELPGVSLLDESDRELPAESLAQSVIGAVDIDNVGISGLELAYDAQLTGTPGRLVREHDPDGRTIPGGRQAVEPAVPGDDLVLTLDRSLQFEAERVLSRQIEDTGAQGGLVVMMEPATGDLLAVATLMRDDEGEIRPSTANTALTDVFEPGSVTKVVTVSAALEEGLVEPGTHLSVPGWLQVADVEFTDSEPHGGAWWSVHDILVRSSNVGTILIAQQLGRDRIDEYLRAFGLGAETGLGFPGESPGIMLDPESWSGTSIATVPIGQGISVTAVQMLAALNVVANGGTYVQPRLVAATVDGEGTRREVPVASEHPVVSEQTAVDVAAMMTDVVAADEGTGALAAIDGYAVAGKTGTARKPLEGGRGYEVGAYMASFAGFLPAEDPRVSMIVVLDEPRSSIYGGVVAAPVFAELGAYAMRHLRVAPSASSPAETDAGDPSSLASAGAPSHSAG